MALSVGAVLAVLAEFYLRGVRHQAIAAALVKPTRPIVDIFLGRLSRARFDAIESTPLGLRRTWPEAFARLTGVGFRSLSESLLDLPFAVIFLLILALLHPYLGLIAMTAVLATWLLAGWAKRKMPQAQQLAQEAQQKFAVLAEQAMEASEVLRAQRAHRSLVRDASERLIYLHQKMDEVDEGMQWSSRFNHFILAGQSVLITAVGAVLVFEGGLSLGALIGANLLAARALSPVSRFLLLSDQFLKLDAAVLVFQRLAALPEESQQTSSLQSSQPELRAEGLSFEYHATAVPVFEGLSFEITVPEILVITGPNGSGKTTLIQILTGLRQPTKGRVLLQGVELRQLASSWWEDQFAYVPQDDRLLDGSIYSALSLATATQQTVEQDVPHAVSEAVQPSDNDQDRLNTILSQVGLKAWLDVQLNGLSHPIHALGAQIPPGIRRKIAISRALLSDASVLFLDEPTQSLDMQGRQGVLAALNGRFKAGTSLVICSDDPDIIRGATQVIDLSHRPSPSVHRRVAFLSPKNEAST